MNKIISTEKRKNLDLFVTIEYISFQMNCKRKADEERKWFLRLDTKEQMGVKDFGNSEYLLLVYYLQHRLPLWRLLQ